MGILFEESTNKDDEDDFDNNFFSGLFFQKITLRLTSNPVVLDIGNISKSRLWFEPAWRLSSCYICQTLELLWPLYQDTRIWCVNFEVFSNQFSFQTNTSGKEYLQDSEDNNFPYILVSSISGSWTVAQPTTFSQLSM